MSVFESYESNVRSYCRVFPDIFAKAEGSFLISESGKRFIDFWCGAGALNYGHNNPYIMEKVLDYIHGGGILHALDLHTLAKREFIETFETSVLKKRGYDYKIQFCGPTGTNGVEAALKLARKFTKRQGIFAFMGAFHGMTLGSLAATGSIESRDGAGTNLPNVTFFPYPDGRYKINSLAYMESVLSDDHSGIAKPAAILLETVQAEGGINVAEIEFLKDIRTLCDRHKILLICDDIQVGCYRTGTFFSFERAKIIPDMVVLSKSISGCGFPMCILLIKRELDIWAPGEHNGTFRGYQTAFVGAKAAIEFGIQNDLESKVTEKSTLIRKFLEKEIVPINKNIIIRGIGMIWGIDFSQLEVNVKEIAGRCYEKGLVIERAGRGDRVLKIMPSLTIDNALLIEGLTIIRDSVREKLLE
jgi:diaminobutyrate-2-oxoglutarate transaminase